MEEGNDKDYKFEQVNQDMFQFGKDVETLCLKMFIKGLTSDLNNSEACKKNKSKKALKVIKGNVF